MIDYSVESDHFVGSIGWGMLSLLWVGIAVFSFLGSDWILFVWSSMWTIGSTITSVRKTILYRREKKRNEIRWKTIIDSYTQ